MARFTYLKRWGKYYKIDLVKNIRNMILSTTYYDDDQSPELSVSDVTPVYVAISSVKSLS